jgi:hypothetical protein
VSVAVTASDVTMHHCSVCNNDVLIVILNNENNNNDVNEMSLLLSQKNHISTAVMRAVVIYVALNTYNSSFFFALCLSSCTGCV